MADNDLLKQAQAIQRQKLLEQAQAIQNQKLAEKPDMGQGKAALIGLEEGATLGLRPAVAGLGAGIGSAVGTYQSGGGLVDILKAGKEGFKQGRQEAIDEQALAGQQYPITHGATSLGGNLATLPLMPVAGTIKGAAALGAGLGAAKSIGEAQSPQEAAGNIAGGAVLGGASLPIANKVSSALANVAESKAFKAAGAMLKDFRAAYSKNPEKINELGRTMLDNNLVRAGDTVESIAQKAEALRRETGQRIGKVYEKVLDKITDPQNSANLSPEAILNVQASGFHPEAEADELKSMIFNKFKGQPGSTGAIKKANQVIDEMALNGNHITPQAALELKGQIDSMINWSKKSQDLPLEQDALKTIRTHIQNKLNSQVAALDQALQSNETSELQRLNQLYGNVSTIANISRDRALREGANRSFGLTDTVAGAGGLGVGHAIGSLSGHGSAGALLGGAALGLGNKIGRTYGNAVLASGANAISQGLENNATPLLLPVTNLIKNPSKIRENK